MISSLSQDTLLIKVWLKFINAYHRYSGNNIGMDKMKTHHNVSPNGGGGIKIGKNIVSAAIS